MGLNMGAAEGADEMGTLLDSACVPALPGEMQFR